MSEPIPESVPTSADPRSKRPLKKSRTALSPTSLAADTISILMSKPDQEIIIPPSASTSAKPRVGLPPEIVANVQGSSAGAGSGEFHVYKASRRREYERVRAMEEEVRKETEGKGWEEDRAKREEVDRERTRKNREKREKMKRRKGKGGKGDERAEGPKVAGIKARVDGGRREENRNGDDGEEDDEVSNMAGVQNVGVIIHDDD